MKSMKIAGLCLVSMLVSGVVVAGTASAAGPVWQRCTEGGTATKYEDNQCAKLSGSGKFQWNELKSTEAVRITGLTLTLRDTGATGGSSAIQCTAEDEGEGTVGPGSSGKITKFEIKKPKTNCSRVEGGCKAEGIETVRAVNLPWKTELSETEKGVQAQLESTTTGKEPGWEISCDTILGKMTDVCTSEEKKPAKATLLLDQSGKLLTLGEYLSRVRGKCSVGGAEQGEVKGKITVELANGQGVMFSPE
jgi:hypothetical protein